MHTSTRTRFVRFIIWISASSFALTTTGCASWQEFGEGVGTGLGVVAAALSDAASADMNSRQQFAPAPRAWSPNSTAPICPPRSSATAEWNWN